MAGKREDKNAAPQSVVKEDTGGENLQGRCCASCACSFEIIKERVMPPGVDARAWESMPERRRVCRLNPPFFMQLPNGMLDAVQQMVKDAHVCWQWKPAGRLPGEQPLGRLTITGREPI